MRQFKPNTCHVTHLTYRRVVAMFTGPRDIQHALQKLLDVLFFRASWDVSFANKLNFYLSLRTWWINKNVTKWWLLRTLFLGRIKFENWILNRKENVRFLIQNGNALTWTLNKPSDFKKLLQPQCWGKGPKFIMKILKDKQHHTNVSQNFVHRLKRLNFVHSHTWI